MVKVVRFCALVMVLGVAALAVAGPKVKTPPAPLNKDVKFEPYPDTDIAQVTYLTSRQEFRVGHPPWDPMRFHVAEFTLVAEHVRKYQRPDFKAEIQLAPPRLRTVPELMSEKNFQAKWKSVMGVYDKLQGTLKALKVPGPCKAAFEAYHQAFLDDQFVAKAVAERMFKAQDLRSRELLREDLKPRFRDTDKDWFDRLFDDFEKDANLSAFYPRFIDLFLEPEFAKAKEEAEKAMKAVGIEYAVATTEDKDIDQQ